MSSHKETRSAKLLKKLGSVAKRDIKRGAKIGQKVYNTVATGFASYIQGKPVTMVDKKGKPLSTYIKTKKK
jgi:hypothetical protein